MGDEDLRERLTRVETKMESLDQRHAETKQAVRELAQRFNRFIMSMLTMLGGAVLGMFGWLVKKLGG